MARRNRTPSYRLHKSSGQAVVTLTDALSGTREDYLLGLHGTRTSRVEFRRLIGARGSPPLR
jgi:hypothetical protein